MGHQEEESLPGFLCTDAKQLAEGACSSVRNQVQPPITRKRVGCFLCSKVTVREKHAPGLCVSTSSAAITTNAVTEEKQLSAASLQWDWAKDGCLPGKCC